MGKLYFSIFNDPNKWQTYVHKLEEALERIRCGGDMVDAVVIAREALAGGSDQELRCDCYPSKENWMVCRYCGKDLGDGDAVPLSQTQEKE